MSADDVIGYLTTCEACGGRALTLHRHGADWRCPSCPDLDAPQPFSADQQPITVSTLDPLAAAIWREVGDRLKRPRVLARVGDQFFVLRKIEISEGCQSTTQWHLEPDQDKQLAPWAHEDSEPPPPHTVKLPAEFDKPTGIAALLRHHGVRVEFVKPVADDEYPVGQVRG